MVETITWADQNLSWYLRSLRDHDTHRGRMYEDGTVLACCGLSFTPCPTLRMAGPPPGKLVTAEPALPGSPPDPDQVCQQCELSTERLGEAVAVGDSDSHGGMTHQPERIQTADRLGEVDT